MPQAAIVGSGLIGRAWALVFARSGWTVTMTDPSAEVRAGLENSLTQDCSVLERHGLAGSVGDVVARITVAAKLEEAVAGAAFVQENGPEDCGIKRRIFTELDRFAPPEAILASSTSAIVGSRFTEDLPGRARCVVGHPVNPPHLVPLVEICAAPWTSETTIERTREVYSQIGQIPVMVKREVDGFVLNRLQGALLAEAFRLVRDGVVSPEDLDKTVKHGLGLRWSFMGPFETIELNAPGGIADYCARYNGFYQRLMEDPPGADAFAMDAVEKVLRSWPYEADVERIAALTDWRNERLAALQAHKSSCELGATKA
ncbi:3-hydroxyacyl-CoA dehydrogenase [Pelagibius sp. Alg239-R121]|uniref:3-hydroxyacyl-CoA dehydrogenase n=1 Tax=Pelagibius sp. Alg239-R121 TaxID=2993448 RepID=UPI0024A70815|nr:3-hydroxyacyl-CoA dehydrogenase [Pelagibius sp. Alg239-R121]